MLITASTSLYGIIGRPVGHSLSPVMHNRAFQQKGIDAVYLAFETSDTLEACSAMRTLGIKGYSVTIPNKESIISHLDTVDETVSAIGACNTVKNQNGHLIGTNTDWLGGVTPLKRRMELKGKRALVLGAGGSARALVYGLLREGADVFICNRTVDKAQRLAKEFGCQAGPLDMAQEIKGDILINTTSVGMGELKEQSPVPKAAIKNFDLVMDIVYAPLETTLLRWSKQLGRITVNGLEMLLYQAVAQFQFWTGEEAPIDAMKEALENVSNQ